MPDAGKVTAPMPRSWMRSTPGRVAVRVRGDDDLGAAAQRVGATPVGVADDDVRLVPLRRAACPRRASTPISTGPCSPMYLLSS